MKRRLNNSLYYFTVEDESLLAETFPRIDRESYAISYKVAGTDDVFITTAESRDAMDRSDVPYNALAEEDGNQIGLYHSAQSREELGDFDDALKALTVAYRCIGAVCVGTNGESSLDLSDGVEYYSYFIAPAGHTFIWRIFENRQSAIDYMAERYADDPEAQEWAQALPLESAAELADYH